MMNFLRRILGLATVYSTASSIKGDNSNGKKDTISGAYFHKQLFVEVGTRYTS